MFIGEIDVLNYMIEMERIVYGTHKKSRTLENGGAKIKINITEYRE